MAAGPLPIFAPQSRRALPDYLPARMVNEFVYCPRLFFYEFVEGLFRESSDTLEGSAQHKRVDREGKGLPKPEQAAEEDLQTRSITLSSESHRVIAKLDVLEVSGGIITPVDYKRGKPREGVDGPELWPADRVQLAIQALILRENGYRCDEGLIFYQTTRQRVRVSFDDAVMADAKDAIRSAWLLAESGPIPAPLEDSPKCPGCSMAPICLPDEVHRLTESSEPDPVQLALFAAGEGAPPKKGVDSEVRRLLTPRDDLRPVYLNTPGLRVGKSGSVLQVKERDSVIQEIRLNEICHVNLFGNVQLSTQAIQTLCEAEIPICYFSMGGWFYGITTGMSTKNVFLRQTQFSMAAEPWFCRRLARSLVAGKIRNQRTFLQRNHIEPNRNVLQQMKECASKAEEARSLEELLGIEGTAARLYFGSFQGLLKLGEDGGDEAPEVLRFDFQGRNRRPPRDAVNALLSLGYSMLAKDLTIACYAVGFDPMIGFFHQPRFGRPALALDLMEPFRALIVDSAVVNAINTRMVTPGDFVQVGSAVALRQEGRKAFYRSYELRMDSLVTHPLFEYRVSYRRMLEIQARLLGKVLQGEIGEYPVFVTH
jgi:CRISP-associated protein Cas1